LRLSSLFVISRNSAFFYKGKTVKTQDLGKELGVKYVLEGSVRKAGDQVRITAQLIDAPTDHHLWSERYDRPLKDIFALQDEIVQKIVTTLKLQLSVWEQGRPVRKTTDNLEAYDYYLRGMESFNRFTKEANAQARQLFEQAIELDPQYAEAYAILGMTYQLARVYQWSQDPQALERVFELEQKAVALDDSLPMAHGILSLVYLSKRQYEQAMAEAERAISLAPNSGRGYVALGIILNFTGQAEKAIGVIEQALRLDPRYPVPYQGPLGWAYLLTRRYDEAIATQKKALSRNPNMLDSHLILTISYSELGREEEARAEAAEVLRLSPTYSLEVVRQTLPYKNLADMERTLTALRKAGLK
jgi:adenylate cyclase